MTRLTGVKQARARARKRPDVLDDLVITGITETVNEVHRAGRENIDAMVKRRSGVLRRNYRKSVRPSKFIGMVGYLSASARRKAFYARFVHDGTAFLMAKPFHDLAVEEQIDQHASRMRNAQHQAISNAGSPSSLGRTGRGKVRGV